MKDSKNIKQKEEFIKKLKESLMTTSSNWENEKGKSS